MSQNQSFSNGQIPWILKFLEHPIPKPKYKGACVKTTPPSPPHPKIKPLIYGLNK
jgi:hypothetical protein